MIKPDLSPKVLFQIDAIGALTSALMLGVVLVHFQEYVGIPIHILCILAAIPIGFVIFDIAVLITTRSSYRIPLRIIASLNLTYCLVSLLLAYYHSKQITLLGWLYITGEIFLVILISFLEIKASNSTMLKS